MNRIINGICEMFPDADPNGVVAMLNKAGEAGIEFHHPNYRAKKVEYHVAGSWLTRDHLRGTDAHPHYLKRIDAFEQRLGARLVRPRHTNWTLFQNLRGHRGHYKHLGSDWTDHPAAFDGGDTRYLVTQPYAGTREWQECPKVETARRWAQALGFDHFEALPPDAGFWNPGMCHVFVLTKKRSGA